MPLTITDTAAQTNLLRILNRLTLQQNISAQRLATGSRINSAADDPAGLIAVTRFDHEIAAVESAQDNIQRADAMLNVASGAVTEISSLLTSITSLVTKSGNSTGITDAERAANQMQIDAAIDSIDRIVRSTSFNGQRLIDGTQAIQTYISAGDAQHIKDVRVHTRPSTSSSTTLTVNVAAAATKASTQSTGYVDMAGANATLSADTTLTITGEGGSTSITIASGSDQTAVINAINDVTDLTGVEATTSGTAIRLTSQNYGTDAFVSVTVLGGDEDFVNDGNVSKISGTDATVTVNGASAGVDGTAVSYTGNGMSVDFTLADNTTGTRTIQVLDGGATFQLGTDLTSRATIGIGSLYSAVIGDAENGYLADLKSGGSKDLSTDIAGALNAVRSISSRVSLEAARIGGFQKYQLQATANVLDDTHESLLSARSQIADADYAAETAALNRNQVLMQTATAVLGFMNQQKSSILNLLTF
jgi:flagellin